jgi:hypothetical protein
MYYNIDNKKLKILMFDMILHFKFIYNPKKITIVTIQIVHLIVCSLTCRFHIRTSSQHLRPFVECDNHSIIPCMFTSLCVANLYVFSIEIL